MRLLWVLLVIFAGLIVYFGMRKPASLSRPESVPSHELILPDIDRQDPRIVEHKPSTHGYNSRVIEQHPKSQQEKAEAVMANKSAAAPQLKKALSPHLKGLDRIYEIEKRAQHGASNDEIAWLSYYEVLNNVPDTKAKFNGRFDENLMLPVLAFENFLSTCKDLKPCQSWVTAAFVRQGHPTVREEMLKIFYEIFPDPRDKRALREDLAKYGLTLKD